MTDIEILKQAKEALINRDAIRCYNSGDEECRCTLCEIDRYIKEQEAKIPSEIDWSSYEIPNEKIVEYAYLPSGRIVVMGQNDSYWFEKDGTNSKEHLITQIIWKDIKTKYQ